MKYACCILLLCSSACLAVQTKQECLAKLGDHKLEQEVCQNHLKHYSRNNVAAVGVLKKNEHHLYQDKDDTSYVASGLPDLPERIQLFLGTDIQQLFDTFDLHTQIARAANTYWVSVALLVGYDKYPITSISPLQVLISIGFPNPGEQSATAQLFQTGTGDLPMPAAEGAASGFSISVMEMRSALKDRKLGTAFSLLKFDTQDIAAENVITQTFRCSQPDSREHNVVVLCPFKPEKTKTTRKRFKINFGRRKTTGAGITEGTESLLEGFF